MVVLQSMSQKLNLPPRKGAAQRSLKLKNRLFSTKLCKTQRFKSFCSHLNISCNNNIEPTIEVVEAGALPLEFDNDPLNGINF